MSSLSIDSPGFIWPSDDGWPYPDAANEVESVDDALDEDALAIKAPPPHLFDSLDPMERKVVTAHYGLDGSPPRSLRELHHDLGLPREELRESLAGGLAKLRTRLAE